MDTPASQPSPIFSVHRNDLKSYEDFKLLPSSIKRKFPSKTYQVTNDDQRSQFILKVIGPQQSTIREAAEAVGIRYSTAKTILKVYKTEGRVEKKKKRTKKGALILGSETPSPKISDNQNKMNEFSQCTLDPLVLLLTLKENQEFLMKNRVTLPAYFWAEKITQHLCEKDSGIAEFKKKCVI